MGYFFDSFRALWGTLRTMFRPTVTQQFPQVIRPRGERFRASFALLHDEKGDEACIGCLQCERICPSKVIAVKGRLTNVDSRDRKIPWLRLGLRSNDNVEVYHWTLNTEVRPLRAGESTSFTTRLASPPPAASRLEIRFARASEIGSNAKHE